MDLAAFAARLVGSTPAIPPIVAREKGCIVASRLPAIPYSTLHSIMQEGDYDDILMSSDVTGGLVLHACRDKAHIAALEAKPTVPAAPVTFARCSDVKISPEDETLAGKVLVIIRQHPCAVKFLSTTTEFSIVAHAPVATSMRAVRALIETERRVSAFLAANSGIMFTLQRSDSELSQRPLLLQPAPGPERVPSRRVRAKPY